MPQRSVFRYEWRHPRVNPTVAAEAEKDPAEVRIGEEVWMKPPNSQCTSQWRRGVTTDINSRNNISVDGMPRHILDIRRVVDSSDESEDESLAESMAEESSDEERGEE